MLPAAGASASARSAAIMADLQAHKLLAENETPEQPVVNVADTMLNLLLGSVFFMWSVLQQGNLQRSPHFAAILYALFYAFAAVVWLQQRVSAALAAGGGAVERFALAVLSMAYGYLGGLLARFLVTPLTSGPHVGDFGFEALLLPFIALLCLTILFAQLRVSSEQYGLT